MIQIPENMKAVFSTSAYDLVMENRKHDLGYRQLAKGHYKLFRSIQDRLGEGDRKLMLKLEAMQNQMASIDDELIYLQGMMDCVALLRTIGLI